MSEAAIPNFFNEEPAVYLREHRMQYLMVNAVSRRVRQLQLGERALAVPLDGNRDLTHVAKSEFLEGKLIVVPKQMFEGNLQQEVAPLDVAADYDTLGLSEDFGSEDL